MMAKDWRDERVKAAFIMAPGWAWIFDEESLRRIPIPTYLIAASADTVLVAKNNAGFFARSIPKALYQEIPGKADHYIFISALNDRQKKRADPEGRLTYLSEDDVSVDRTWIQLQLVEQAVGFFESALAYDPE
jgi:predicted dienelactone hydrolase